MLSTQEMGSGVIIKRLTPQQTSWIPAWDTQASACSPNTTDVKLPFPLYTLHFLPSILVPARFLLIQQLFLTRAVGCNQDRSEYLGTNLKCISWTMNPQAEARVPSHPGERVRQMAAARAAEGRLHGPD